jgi:hypothetical protein
MRLLKNIFSRNKSVKSIYIAGYGYYFTECRQYENYIETHITDKETVEHISEGVELVFEDGKLVRAFEYADGEKSIYELTQDVIGLNYLKTTPKRKLSLVIDQGGFHQLGGDVPDYFILPQCSCAVPFQYLGYINNLDPQFSYLHDRIHLACPIYLNISRVFLDYSDPERPFIINKDEVESAGTSFEDLNQDSIIVYNKRRFDFVDAGNVATCGLSGLPSWKQIPDIPTCPNSGKLMKFICQLNGGVTVRKSNIICKFHHYSRRYFEDMNFWCDGDLFVFFEPTSKVACYFIQNT